ncbi:NAD(P)-binding protein [Methylobacterium sp. NEAU 140]|uniref:NAD(P)/FAD-dependent oxidoreductase n=1 Tax=Methylobacterium sp. NEAU 140 TaxID=3064945 RepID=UPI00273737C2|nr:NAD(P)-binding protein [Methylobacterium sp. NEAU 140]MDP4021325.1 NAD(P)-binding protein [Methylobacterium sp. NEAU 140]
MGGAPEVAILGAGMAGATAARRLAEAGFPVRVFDKGRGVGGRMATRRVAERGLAFDHGAQFFRARGPAFAGRVAAWERRGVSAPWAGAGRHVGVPGMTAPVHDLLAGLPVATATTIVRIGGAAGRWHLTDAAGAEHGPFTALAVTCPAPQTAALLAASGLALPGVERATYAPCWSLMAAVPGGPDTLLEGGSSGPIGLIVRDASKPGRPPGGRLVVHATPDWSRDHLEAERETVAAELLRALAGTLGAALRPTWAAAHRWRYAQVETALDEPCLYDPRLRLGAAGDWCLGPRIEAAHDSGLALADRLIDDLGAAR